MKIYNRTEFMKLPSGVLYRKGKPCYFNNFKIKGDTIGPDFGCMDIGEWDAHDSGEWSDIYYEMINGASIPMTEDAYSRDGYFDDDDLFLVFEQNDLIKIKKMIDDAINVMSNKDA